MNLATTCLFLAVIAAPAFADEVTPVQVVPAAETHAELGRLATVQGVVSICKVCRHLPGEPLKLLLDKPAGGDEPFAILVPGELREDWQPPLEVQAPGRTVRVTGRVTSFQGRPEIVLARSEDLRLVDSADFEQAINPATQP